MKTTKQEWNFPVTVPGNLLKKYLKNLIGKSVLLVNPKIKNELLKGRIPKNNAERAALASIFIGLKNNNQFEKLAELHKKIWSSNSTQGYYDLTSNRLREMFSQMEGEIHSSISKLLKNAEYEEFIELGCGEGYILGKLQKNYSKDFNIFLGIDINEKQISINNKKINSTNLKYHTADITKETALIKGSKKIYMTFGGVLEYLTEKELLDFLKEIGSYKDNALIIYEPIKAGFNYTESIHSILYGGEFSFSHPYKSYLKNCGFTIENEKLIKSKETYWLFLSTKVN